MPKKIVILRQSIGNAVQVEREANVIRNVAIITAGKTKTSGNGMPPFDVDAVTLQQVADAINKSGSVKSRLTHPELDEQDPIRVLAGKFSNARVDGNRVIADFTPGGYAAFSASGNIKEFLFALAEDAPGDAGVSIVSETATLEKSNTETGSVLRLTQLDAVDWTGSPAANPAGMLSAIKGATLMEFNEQQMEALVGMGLPEGGDAVAFYETLSDEQKAAINALAVEATPAAPVSASEDEEDEKVMAADYDEEEKKPATMSAKGKKSGVTLQQKPQDVDAAVKLALKAERQRVASINGVALKCGYDQKWIKEQIESDRDINEVNRIALANLKRSPSDMPTGSVQVGADHNRDTLQTAVQDAIMLRAGIRNFVEFNEKKEPVMLSARGNEAKARTPHERSQDFVGHSVIEMGRRYLVALGYGKADKMDRPQLASLLMSRSKLMSALSGVYMAHGTGDFPEILADTMGKVLRQEYTLAPHTWSMWCGRNTAPDFKDIKKLQLSEAADMMQVREGEEYTYTTLSESKETYRLAKYGNGLKFTWESMINDDLNAFSSLPRKLGRAARRFEETTAIGILTANANLADGIALFASGHSNLTTGTLSVTSLGAARSLMRKQTAFGSDDPLETMPRYLLVPETISTLAQQLVSSTVDPAKSNATPNPFANQLQVIPSARLDTTSTAQWYLLADPGDIDTVEMSFLQGNESPVVEEEDEFDSDARKMKIRHVLAAKAIDYRGLVRSSGS